jgi:hypothetical protein
MLFSYIYVPHQMERMQRFINYIFYQVWCRALKAGPYTLSLFDENPPLKEVMTSFAYDHTEAGDRFSSQVQDIYECFSQLSRREIAQFKRWFQANNSIEEVCGNSLAVPLARYSDIGVTHDELSKKFATFFKGLYSQSLLDLAALRAKVGDIDSHYKLFVETNDIGKCPFCGVNDLLGGYHHKREAYDHYLPKAFYPFNSINFKNLVPACHHCNSSYKSSKDPAYTPKDPAGTVRRRAVFYPYKAALRSIELQITLRHLDIENLTSDDIVLQFGPGAISQEIETWKDVYGIEERYKAKLRGKSDGKYWLWQLEEWEGAGHDPEDYFTTVTHQAREYPYAECNFLKKPFLEACRNVQLI